MCIVFLLALVAPRVALGALWLFTDRVDRAFDDILWPILGIVFLPWATIMYAVLWDPLTEITDSEWLIVAGAVAVDLISWSSRLGQTRSPYG